MYYIHAYSWLAWNMSESFPQPPKSSVFCLHHNAPIAKINYTLSLVPLKTARSSNKHESKIKSYLYIHYILILTTGYVLSGPYDLL